MALAIFGIKNNGLNLAATLFLLMLIVLWLALIVYTYLDARRRISDPFLVACATVASFFPYIGTAVYAIVHPPSTSRTPTSASSRSKPPSCGCASCATRPAPTASTRSRRTSSAARTASAG